MPCLVAIASEKALALFPQKLVTSGAMRSKRKMNSPAGRASWSAIRTSAFFDPGADIPIYPFTASSLGRAADRKGLSFKGYSESLPAIGPKIDVDPPNCSGHNCIYGRKHVPWIGFTSIPKGAHG